MLMRTTQPLLLPSPDGRSAVAADPRSEIRGGLAVAAAFFLLFLGWAAFARLDAAALAPGRTTVAGQRQSVQHRDGGIVAAILVKEGQAVRQGEVLIRLAAPAVAAQERVLASQAIWLIAQRARLRAEQAGTGMEVPVEFRNLTGTTAPMRRPPCGRSGRRWLHGRRCSARSRAWRCMRGVRRGPKRWAIVNRSRR